MSLRSVYSVTGMKRLAHWRLIRAINNIIGHPDDEEGNPLLVGTDWQSRLSADVKRLQIQSGNISIIPIHLFAVQLSANIVVIISQ